MVNVLLCSEDMMNVCVRPRRLPCTVHFVKGDFMSYVPDVRFTW